MLKQSQVTASNTLSVGSTLVVYASLFKLRIVWLLLFVSFVAAFVAAGGLPQTRVLIVLLVTGAMAASGAGALNHYLERDLDPLMARTRSRPLVTGEIARPEIVLWVGLGLIVASLIIAAPIDVSLALFLFLGAFVYVVVYTMWLKRRGPSNIVIGGLAGSCAVLAGWSAVAPWLRVEPLLLALLLFFWTPAHFWSLALVRVDDYRRAGVPMLPAVVGSKRTGICILGYALMVTAVSVALAFAGSFGWLYQTIAIGSGLAFAGAATVLAWSPREHLARLNFWISLIYLVTIFAGITTDIQMR